MGPMMMLVVAANDASGGNGSSLQHVRDLYREQGIQAFTFGTGPLALRQASNWASRQTIMDVARTLLLKCKGGGPALSVPQEILCGSIAGILSTWNQPFETLRIHQQTAQCRMCLDGASGGPGARGRQSAWEAARTIVREDGLLGLYRGLVPRICQAIWQTNVLLTASNLLTSARGRP